MFASAQCTGTRTASSYMLSWEVSYDGLSVEFNVSVTTAANTWVAVGFTATLSMVSSCTSFLLHRSEQSRRTPIIDLYVRSLNLRITIIRMKQSLLYYIYIFNSLLCNSMYNVQRMNSRFHPCKLYDIFIKIGYINITYKINSELTWSNII